MEVNASGLHSGRTNTLVVETLKIALGWTQRKLAQELGISRRSLIRYEKAQRRSPWPRLSVLLRLRQVEAEHEQQLLGYFSRLGR